MNGSLISELPYLYSWSLSLLLRSAHFFILIHFTIQQTRRRTRIIAIIPMQLAWSLSAGGTNVWLRIVCPRRLLFFCYYIICCRLVLHVNVRSITTRWRLALVLLIHHGIVKAMAHWCTGTHCGGASSVQSFVHIYWEVLQRDSLKALSIATCCKSWLVTQMLTW